MRFAAVFILLISFLPLVYSFPAEDVVIINDRDYFPRVHKLLQDANSSIYVIMYSAYYYERFPHSYSNMLLEDLEAAKKRGLIVKVILEKGGIPRPAFGRPPLLGKGEFAEKEKRQEQNKDAAEFLKAKGVPYKFDSEEITTHAKLIIVDGLYTVIGSTNWSYSALVKNHETSVVIKSKEIAKSYIRYFEGIE